MWGYHTIGGVTRNVKRAPILMCVYLETLLANIFAGGIISKWNRRMLWILPCLIRNRRPNSKTPECRFFHFGPKAGLMLKQTLHHFNVFKKGNFPSKMFGGNHGPEMSFKKNFLNYNHKVFDPKPIPSTPVTSKSFPLCLPLRLCASSFKLCRRPSCEGEAKEWPKGL